MINLTSEIVYSYTDFDGKLVNVLKIIQDGIAVIKQKLAPQKVKVNDLKILQRDLKCYNRKEVYYDVYCDRVNFIGYDFPCQNFFHIRNIILFRERAGYSIDIEDAKKIGLPIDFEHYKLPSDSRKSPVPMTKTKSKHNPRQGGDID